MEHRAGLPAMEGRMEHRAGLPAMEGRMEPRGHHSSDAMAVNADRRTLQRQHASFDAETRAVHRGTRMNNEYAQNMSENMITTNAGGSSRIPGVARDLMPASSAFSALEQVARNSSRVQNIQTKVDSARSRGAEMQPVEVHVPQYQNQRNTFVSKSNALLDMAMGSRHPSETAQQSHHQVVSVLIYIVILAFAFDFCKSRLYLIIYLYPLKLRASS